MKTKEARIDFRVRPSVKFLIREAAQSQHMTLSEFVLRPAIERAEALMAERGSFPLPKEKWDAFNEALDKKPRSIPALKKLLKEPGVFDG